MVKAARLPSFDDLGRYIHTMQLVINCGLKAQRAVIDTITAAQTLVGHFRHSTKATEVLKTMQQNHNMKTLTYPKHQNIGHLGTW
jgi:hypothetical protein